MSLKNSFALSKNYTFWIRRPTRKQRHVWVKTTAASSTLLKKKKSFDLIWVDQICSINKSWYFRTPQISRAAKRWTLKYHSRFLSQIPLKLFPTKIKTALWYFGIFLSPLLKIGITLSIFHLFGKRLETIVVVKMCVRANEKAGAAVILTKKIYCF